MASKPQVEEPAPAPPKPITYRLLGIPTTWRIDQVESFLAEKFEDAELEVESLALDSNDEFQTATVDSHDGTKLPTILRVPATPTSKKISLATDGDFLGLTTLFRPPPEDHLVDVITVCGLGGHAYGSFRNKQDHHMWLRDSLPSYVTSTQTKRPMARIMTYGYKSPVRSSESFASLEDLANSFYRSLSTVATQKPLVLIGHSLGGLVVKQAIVTLAKSEKKEHQQLHEMIYGIAFFGVPHHGLRMKELIAMSEEGPNLGLLTSLSDQNSMVLDILKREFHAVLGDKGQREVVSFYETEMSPTATKLENGEWEISGPKQFLVTKSSATHGRDWESGPQHIVPINASHSDMVKISHFAGYKREVLNVLRDLSRQALQKPDRPQDPRVKFIVPYERNADFVGRESVLQKLKATFELEKPPLDRHCRKTALSGLGGIGKTQIAIAFAYGIQREHKHISVLWVHASNSDRFRRGYEAIADEFDIPGRDDPQKNLLTVVKEFLRRQENGQWVMIIDNADDKELFFPSKQDQADDEDPDSSKGLSRYIPDCNHGSVLVTTRSSKAAVNHMAGRSAIVIEKLSEEESRSLIRRLGGEKTTSEDAKRLSDHLEGIPLAIAQAVSFMNQNAMSVERYCELLEDGDSVLFEQLSQEFGTDGRDDESLNAVAKTWMISFDHIRSRDPLASKFLSIMSFFDRQAIPEEFLIEYQKLLQDRSATSAPELRALLSRAAQIMSRSRKASMFPKGKFKKSSKQQLVDSNKTPPLSGDTTLVESQPSIPNRTESIGTLIAFSFITKTKDGSYNMHRLVRLVTRKWLAKKDELKKFGPLAVSIVYDACPAVVEWQTIDEVMRLLPHMTAVTTDEEMGEEEATQTQRDRGIILLRKGSYFDHRSQYQDAAFYAEKARRVLEAAVGAKHEDTFNAAGLVFHIYNNQGRSDEVIEIGEAELDRCKAALGKGDFITLRMADNLGHAYRQRGMLTEAQKLLETVVEINKSKRGAKSFETLFSLDQLASTYSNQGKVDQALKLMHQVTSGWKELYGERHGNYLTSCHNLAMIYRGKGDLNSAAKILTDVVKNRKKVIGSEHAQTLGSMAALALIHHERGYLTEAYELYSKVLPLRRKILGENHPETLTYMLQYALLLGDLGRTPDAIEEMGDCLSRCKNRLGADDPLTLLTQEELRRLEEGT